MWVWVGARSSSLGNGFWNHVKYYSPRTQRRFPPKYIEITFKAIQSTLDL